MGLYEKVAVFALFSAFIAQSSGAGTHLHIDNAYMLTYEVFPQNKTLSLQIEVTGVGWVGFGINNNTGNMDGADLFIGGYNSTSKGSYWQDYHVPKGNGNVRPTVDTNNDWTVTHAAEKDSKTTIYVQRPLEARDAGQDVTIENRTQYLVWSFHKDSDNVTNTIHSTKGSCQINLIQGGTGTCEMKSENGANTVMNIGMSTLLMAVVAAVLKN